MSNPHIIDPEVHKDWWRQAIEDPTRRLLMLEDERIPTAVIVFFELAAGASAKWGFYADPLRRPRPGSLAMWADVAAIAYAFDWLRLDTLFCEVKTSNAGLLLLHDRVGFQDTGRRNGDFDERRFTRAEFERSRHGPRLAKLSEVAIEPDPRDIQISATSAPRPATETNGEKRAAILGSANWALAAHDLAETCHNALGHTLQVTAPPPGQYAADLADPSSALRRHPPDLLIFAERFEDMAGAQGEVAGIDVAVAQARFATYLKTIRSARQVMPGRFLINTFAPVRPRAKSIAEAVERQDTAVELASTFNRALAQLVDLADVRLVPLADQVEEVGRRVSDPGKYWFMDRIPFGQPLVDRWTSCVAGMIAADEGRTIRAIICDLDDTIWPGCIGEAATNLSEDWPGNAFLAVQRCLKMLADRGVILAICSKSQEDTALEALSHPAMILKDPDFSARCINWDPKPEGVRRITAELGLAEDVIMVLDNDPLERAEMRVALPRVFTPELPWDIVDWPRFLVNHPLLTQMAVTPEDAGR